jgi:hypothetical protein
MYHYNGGSENGFGVEKRILMTFSEKLDIRAFGLNCTCKANSCLKSAKPKQISDVEWVRSTFDYVPSPR